MLTIEKVKKIYELVKRINKLKEVYGAEIRKIEEERKIITLENIEFVFANSSITSINQKKLILEELLNIYLAKAQILDATKTSFKMEEVIPGLDELILKTHVTGNKLIELLYIIAVDFVQANLEDYYNNKFTQKEIASLLLVSDKGISTRLLKLNISKKKFYDKETIDMAIKEVCKGKKPKVVSEELKINESTLGNEIRKIKKKEIYYNDRDAADIGHDEVIERLGGVAIKAGLDVYSEHITRYKANIGNGFRRIDLVCKKEEEIIAAVEVEISNDLTKSLNNLVKEYKDAKLRILFVHESKLEEAIRIRNQLISEAEVKVIKIHKGFEESFSYMLKENK